MTEILGVGWQRSFGCEVATKIGERGDKYFRGWSWKIFLGAGGKIFGLSGGKIFWGCCDKKFWDDKKVLQWSSVFQIE